MTQQLNRYTAKRNAGISPIRRDGSMTSQENDRQAEAAERYAANYLGVPFNGEVYHNHGDGGHDFKVEIRGKLWTVEVVWAGIDKHGKPRTDGNLIINPMEPWRFADVYVVVIGSIETHFRIEGCCNHKELTYNPPFDFGYGKRFYLPFRALRPIQILVQAIRGING